VLFAVMRNTEFVINQVGNLAQIARNIEEKLGVWRNVAEVANVSTSRHLQSPNRKPIRV
jgi:hypothetical protein